MASHNENVDPQRRKARPSAVVAARLAVDSKIPTGGNGGDARRSSAGSTTGIQRSFESISRVLPSPRVAGGSGESIMSGRSSLPSSRNRGNQSSTAASRTSTGSKSQKAAAKDRGAKGTGIERSYDSVTQTIKSVASFVGGNTPRSGASAADDVAGEETRASTFDGRGSSMASTSLNGPPVPVASTSFSFDDGSIAASTAASRVGHIISASASMSMDDFEKLRRESRQLKAVHEARYGADTTLGRDSLGSTVASARASIGASTNASGRSNSKARDGSMSKHSRSGNNKPAELHRLSSTATQRTTNIISNKSHQDGSLASNERKKVAKNKKGGVAKMTTKGFSKIRGVLNMNSKGNSDDMSFFCSDEYTGRVAKEKVSLDRLEIDDDGTDVYSDTFMNQVPNDKRVGSRALPQSPTHGKSNVKRATKQARASSIDKKQGLGLKLEEVAKTTVKVTKEGVDVVANEVAPKIGTGIAATAMSVVKVAQQSVEGVGMLAKDLANAKTPARSNVTRHKGEYQMEQQLFQVHQRNRNDGKYADYVHDPNYKVVLTPPPHGVETNDKTGKTPYTYCDQRTPGVLLGAVTAGRCNLPGTHPGSLEFLPGGIPRVLVVHDNWEERAGFAPINAVDNAIGVTGVIGESPPDSLMGPGMRSGSPRVSNPIDMDEETDTVNGEEVDREEMMALKEGRPSPKNANGQPPPPFFNDEEADDEGEEDEEAGTEEKSEEAEIDDNDMRNASMWVAVPADIDDDDEDLLDSTMHVEDINMGDLLLDNCEENTDSDLVELAKGWTPTSVGSGTFFVGDVQIGFESTPESTKRELLAEDAKHWTPDSKQDGEPNEDQGRQESKQIGANGVLEAQVAAMKIDEFDVCQRGQPQAPAPDNVEDEDSLLSLAKNTTAAVVHEKKKEFETPFSVKKGERQLSLTEFKAMNKQVLFDLKGEGDIEAHAKDLYSMESVDGLRLNRSESTELSHEPPVRMVGAAGGQELYLNPSESTDLSQFSNWKSADKQESKECVRHSNVTGDASKESKSGKRQLKGRVILVRIKKKISKVAKKMLFMPFGAKGNGGESGDHLSIMEESFVLSLAKSNNQIPASPSSISGRSVSSSIMTGNVSATKRIIGAVPPKNGSPNQNQVLYGTINYGVRSMEDSTMDGSDPLPPPPANLPLPPLMASCGEEDAVSYLAKAMKHSEGTEDDDEDSVLLLLTPRGDGTEECQIISAADGTPVQMRDIIDASNDENTGVLDSHVKPNNLSCLFTDEEGSGIQIMDAMEVEGGIVLTPRDANHNVSHVFRDGLSDNILPGSVDSDDEDETLLYHDGCTVIHQTSTFGDNTIASMATAKEGAPNENEGSLVAKEKPCAAYMGIGTPILSPDRLPLTRQAAGNGSYLFSPDNMGRANPIVRAKERALLKGKEKRSITMLPPAKEVKKIETAEGDAMLVIRQSYSYSSYLTSTDAKLPSSSDSVSLTLAYEEADDDDLVDQEVTEGGFESAQVNSSPEVTLVKDQEQEEKTPLVSNAVSIDNEDTLPLLVTLNTSCSSPASASTSSFKSANGRKRSSPKNKPVPKSALKTRKGFVKERITDIQHRIGEGSSGAVIDVNGRLRLKRNHSYRYKNSRRMTNGNGVLAPRKAVLQTTYIRSVPIGIAKTYSRDSIGNNFSQDDGYSINEEDTKKDIVAEDTAENTVSYAFKYTGSPSVPQPIDSFDENGNRFSDASSYVSEAADNDPFSSLLGRMEGQDEESGSSEDSSRASSEDAAGEMYGADDSLGKENATNTKNNVFASSYSRLPFKASTLVKPTELHQHKQHEQQERTALSPVIAAPPMQARKWRTMAAAAAEKKEATVDNGSARFRTEKSWRHISGI